MGLLFWCSIHLMLKCQVDAPVPHVAQCPGWLPVCWDPQKPEYKAWIIGTDPESQQQQLKLEREDWKSGDSDGWDTEKKQMILPCSLNTNFRHSGGRQMFLMADVGRPLCNTLHTGLCFPDASISSSGHNNHFPFVSYMYIFTPIDLVTTSQKYTVF